MAHRQKQPVRVIYLGYANSSQMTCLGLMAKEDHGVAEHRRDVPESGSSMSRNQDGDSVEGRAGGQVVTV